MNEPVSLHSYQHLVLSLFLILAVLIFHHSFNLHLLTANNGKHLFTCLFASSAKCLFMFSDPFLIRFFGFFLSLRFEFFLDSSHFILLFQNFSYPRCCDLHIHFRIKTVS